MRRCIAATALIFAPLFAAHAESVVDQVERLDIERGEFEWELQNVYAQATDDEASVLLMNLSAEYGFSERFALGFELETEREGADRLSADEVGLQFKFAVLNPEDDGFGLGAQFSLEHSFEDDELGAEFRLLVEQRFQEFVLATDIVLSTGADSEAGGESVGVRYQARLDWERSWGVFALEAGGDLGTFDAFTDVDEARHWLGAVAGFEAGPIGIELGGFGGLTEETPDLQLRLELELR